MRTDSVFLRTGSAIAATMLSLAARAEACPLCGRALAQGGTAHGGNPASAFALGVYLLLAIPFLLAAFYGVVFWRLLQSAESPGDSTPVAEVAAGS